jgi:hypothetical protein
MVRIVIHDAHNYKYETGRVLVCGSGSYMKDWIPQNRDLLPKYDEVFCINTCSVIMDYTHIWARSTDFFSYNKFVKECDFITINKPWVKFSITRFEVKPMWYMNKPTAIGGDTMFLNTVYHINNVYSRDVQIDCIGCDFDYNSAKTHFYGNGKPDPLRHGIDKLKIQLGIAVKELKIKNISGNSNALWGIDV